MAERALQQGTAPAGVGVTKWRWLVLEAERAAGCSCMVHRTQNPSAWMPPHHAPSPPLVAFEPTHTEAELASAREAHAAHFTSHIAPEIAALHGLVHSAGTGQHGGGRDAGACSYNGLKPASGHGIVTVQHAATWLQRPYSPCGNLSPYEWHLADLWHEHKLFAEEMTALGLDTAVEYGPIVAQSHAPLVAWSYRNHHVQGAPLRAAVLCLLLLNERLQSPPHHHQQAEHTHHQSCADVDLWLPNEIWLKIFGVCCSADFYR